MRGLFISGNHTEIGKTTIATLIIKILKEIHTVKVRKPVETACKQLVPVDAKTLLAVAGNNEDLAIVCPYRFAKAASAEVASDAKLTLAQLIKACKNQVGNNDVVIIEGAGGLCSPIAKDALNIDLIAALNLPVVLVVKDELGAVNQALLSIKTAKQHQINIVFVVLNQFDNNAYPLDNKSAIEKYGKIPVYIVGSDKGDLVSALTTYNL